MSHFRPFNQSIPKFKNTEIRKSLYAYLQHVRSNDGITCVSQKYPVFYRIIRCDGFSKDGNGFMYAYYDNKMEIFSMTLGDLMICYSFDNKKLPDDFKCLNIENEIREAKVNDGTVSEVFHSVNLVSYKVAYDSLINLIREKFVDCEEKRILNIWKKIRYSIVILPKKPSIFFYKNVC